jgi:hypothetical protein
MKIAKILKKLPTGFADDVESYSEQQLKDAILQSETNINRVENEREQDERLKGAKETLKDLNSPYRDAISAQRAKIAYLLYMLENQGKLPDVSD